MPNYMKVSKFGLLIKLTNLAFFGRVKYQKGKFYPRIKSARKVWTQLRIYPLANKNQQIINVCRNFYYFVAFSNKNIRHHNHNSIGVIILGFFLDDKN